MYTLCEVDGSSGDVVIYLVLDSDRHTLYRIDSSKMNTRIKQI